MPTDELSVLTMAKDLAKYVFVITAKSPKRFRFSLSGRMENYSLEIVDRIIRANDVYMGRGPGSPELFARRQAWQRDALTGVKLLNTLALLAQEQGAVTMDQFRNLFRLLANVQYMLAAWMKKDAERFGRS